MGKNQALSIALILFVIIACVLGGTTYYFKKNADELITARDAAVKSIPGKDAKIEELGNEIQVLKSYLGPEAELAEITAKYNENMKLVVLEGDAAAPAPKAEKAEGEDGEKAEGDDGEKAEGEDGEKAEDGDAPAADAAPGVAKPSYQTVIAFLAEKIKDQNALSAKIEELNLEISSLKTQVDEAREKGKADGVSETEEKFKTQITALNQKIDELNGRVETKDSEIKQQISAKNKLSKERNRLEKETKELVKKNRERGEKIEKLEEIHRESKLPPAESKMGEIVYVDPLGKQGNINLGKKDFLSRGITFSVYEPNNLTEYGLKGTIEVLSVTEDREADVIIYNDDEADPIKVGDVIYTPTWAPGFEEHFAIAGFIDIDDDNQSDLDQVIQLIQQNGGVVDAYQKADGKAQGTVTSQTTCLVLGVKPDEKSAAAARTTYTNMRRAADEYGIKVQQLTDILRKMGYRPSSGGDFTAIPVESRKGRISTGSVSGIYSEEPDANQQRKPPKQSAY